MQKHVAAMASCVALALSTAPGRAEEGLFDFLFGPSEPRTAPSPQRAPRGDWGGPRRSSRGATGELRFARPGEGPGGAAEPSTGGYCVRTCDGYYFPLIKSSHATRQQSCEFACPSAPMAIYDGGSIETARNYKGERYTALPTAFAFRDKTTEKCSCNEPTSSQAFFQRTVKTDPTLRSGDVVIENDGAFVYSGTNLVPLSRASFVPSQIRQRLRTMIRPGVSGAAQESDALAPRDPEVELSNADKTGATTR